ncbi:transcriptional regulator [Phenylobacterium zucineum HLK1]|uniref:Transcriptional regulator n=1 Tax=Phenylobacterium zucineum (strain HLK1) TaxID=450851 RepID=B4RFZ1_PHEZH|nr:FecR domain-containing protein [Phenylobacterium zucineum]ACG78804.1 transcriptional regulator [Phenylobacterium zucineum HLK1]
MSERAATPSRQELEAAEWFAKLNKLSVTTDALRTFREWKKDPDNAAAYAAVERTWSEARSLRSDPDIRRAADEALARRPARPAASRASRLWPAAVVAALLVAVLLVGAAAVALTQRPVSYATAHGEQRLVVLEDGSRLRLNTDTAVTVSFRGEARRLALKRGQAFFEVAHDPSRPFIVTAGDTTVRALGTRFEVWRRNDGARVTLVEGKVSVTRGQQAPTVLAPSQSVVATRDGLTPVTSVDPVQTTGWTTGRLTFRDTPLSEAVAEINRYSAQTIALDPAAPASRPVSGVFDAGDTDAFVDAVGVLLNLEAERQGRIIRLSPRTAAG